MRALSSCTSWCGVAASRRVLRVIGPAFVCFAASLNAQAPSNKPMVVRAGKYACVYHDDQGRHVVPGFEIRGDGSYEHRDKSTGTYELIPKKSQLLFKKGSLDNTLALYDDSNPKAAFIRLYNQKRTETVLNCQTRK